jgi:adenine-specific DNA glycosylase
MSETNQPRFSSSVSKRRPYFRDGWLIQESLPTEWHLLVSAVLLNQSKRTSQWDVTLFRLFERWPTASSLTESDESLESLLKPHGFASVKAKRLRRLSEQYQQWDHQDPRVLYGCGQYAYDSWRIFVKGHRPSPDEINDGALKKFLQRYHYGWRPGQPLPPLFRISERERKGERVRKGLPDVQSTGYVSPRGD